MAMKFNMLTNEKHPMGLERILMYTFIPTALWYKITPSSL